jgi:hypothetical protein
VGRKSVPLTTALSNIEEVDAFLAPVKVQYCTYVTWVGKKSGPLTIVLSTMDEVDAFLAPVKVQYLYVTWVGKKSGPLTTVLSTMEEVDAFPAPVKVQYLCNMGGQEFQTSDHSSLHHGGDGCLPCSNLGTVLM